MQDTKEAAAAMRLMTLDRARQSGARWFYWIAALSLANSIGNMAGGKLNFVIGLATTQFVDGIGMYVAKHHQEMATIGHVMALSFSIMIVAVFFVFGALAMKKQNWAYMLGIVCYAADGLLCLLFQDWLSLGFHGFALYCIFGGMQANKQLEAVAAAANKSAPAT